MSFVQSERGYERQRELGVRGAMSPGGSRAAPLPLAEYFNMCYNAIDTTIKEDIMLASLTNINKFYNGNQILSNVSLTIDETDKIGLVGNNSSFFCAGANLPEICLKSHGRTECAPTKFSGARPLHREGRSCLIRRENDCRIPRADGRSRLREHRHGRDAEGL